MKLWDSTRNETDLCGAKTLNKKIKSHFFAEAHETLENQWAIPKLFTLWDGCELFTMQTERN